MGLPLIDPANSPNLTLAAGETFTGEWTECWTYAVIDLHGFVTDGILLYADLSLNTRDTSTRSVVLTADNETDPGIHSLIVKSKYYRIRVVNRSGTDCGISFQSILYPTAKIAMPTSRASQTVGLYSDVLTTRNITNFDLDIARGKLDGLTDEHKFAACKAVTTTPTDVWSYGATQPVYTGRLTSALQIRIRAGGNPADDVAGAGAQQVTVECLDENWDPVTYVLDTAGAGASLPSAAGVLRYVRAYVSRPGTYQGANTGQIIIETTTGVVMGTIGAGRGQSQDSFFPVRRGYTAYIRKVFAVASGQKNATIEMWKAENANVVSAPFGASRRIWHDFPDINGPIVFRHETWEPFPEYTDIWARAFATTGTSNVVVEYEMVLLPNL